MGAFSLWSFLAQSIQGTGGQKYCLVYLDTFCIAILLFFLLSYHLNLLIQCFFGSQKCRIICFYFDALRITPYFVLSHLRCRSGRYETCATATQHPAQYPHIVKLMLHFYVYASVGEKQTSTGCSAPYRGGSLSHKTTPVQAHRGFKLLTLAS